MSGTEPTLPVILASSSKWRAVILRRHDIMITSFIDPDIDEKAIRHPDPAILTVMIARAKMEAALAKLAVKEPGLKALVIACDQVVVYQGTIREKPVDEEEARMFLRSYKDAPAVCVCGLVIHNTATGKQLEGSESATQYFKEIDEAKIDELIQHGDVLTCAGGFTVECMSDYVDRREGDIETVEGLPIRLTRHFLAELS